MTRWGRLRDVVAAPDGGLWLITTTPMVAAHEFDDDRLPDVVVRAGG